MARKFMKYGGYVLLAIVVLWLICLGFIKGLGVLTKAIRDVSKPSGTITTTSGCNHSKSDGCNSTCHCSTPRHMELCTGNCCKCGPRHGPAPKWTLQHKKVTVRRQTEKLSPFDPDFVPPKEETPKVVETKPAPEAPKAVATPPTTDPPKVQKVIVKTEIHEEVIRHQTVVTDDRRESAPPPAYRDDVEQAPPPRYVYNGFYWVIAPSYYGGGNRYSSPRYQQRSCQ